MSINASDPEPDPKKPSIFDERPGAGVEERDDPNDPGAISPDVIAPDLGHPTPFDDEGPL